VIVIGAARFAVLHEGLHNGIPVESWVYPQDHEAGYHDFAVALPMLTYFEDHIGPYPYEKLANVQSKTRYGGMENASNIFYGENEITGRRRNEITVAHEIAHQWFGNSVTEADWNHVWLSEGFATYFSYLYIEHAYGQDQFLENLDLSRDYVMEYYAEAPTPLVYHAEDVNDYLNTNSYDKGAWLLHMLRGLVGDDAFRAGIERYYAAYRNSNASSADFEGAMEAASGTDLGWFFEEWLYQPGQPAYEGAWRYDADSTRLTVTLRQTQTDSTFFHMPLELGIYADAGDDAAPRIERLTIDEPEETFTFPLNTAPEKVVLDPNSWVLMTSDFKRTPEE
jgi:aminopeptidase N